MWGISRLCVYCDRAIAAGEEVAVILGPLEGRITDYWLNYPDENSVAPRLAHKHCRAEQVARRDTARLQ